MAAVKRAGYSPRTADRSGPRLLCNVGIQAALTDAIEARAKRAELDADFVLDFLRGALEADDAPLTARVRSAELLGKHLGMFTEKRTVTSTPPPPMRLIVIDQLEKPPVPIGENEKGLEVGDTPYLNYAINGLGLDLPTRNAAIIKYNKGDKSMNILNVINRFQTQDSCIDHLESIRYKDDAYCPHCGSIDVARKADGQRVGRWNCHDCQASFNVLSGTIFQGTHLPLQKWFCAIAIIVNAKKSLSSHQLSRDLSISQSSAWYMQQRIRSEMVTKAGKNPAQGHHRS